VSGNCVLSTVGVYAFWRYCDPTTIQLLLGVYFISDLTGSRESEKIKKCGACALTRELTAEKLSMVSKYARNWLKKLIHYSNFWLLNGGAAM
jgi:hypothetical protein